LLGRVVEGDSKRSPAGLVTQVVKRVFFDTSLGLRPNRA
jgi:hypothetical protein